MSGPNSKDKSLSNTNADTKTKTNNYTINMSTGRYIYIIFHMIMTIVAVYLSRVCNKEYSITSVLIAIIFPYFYIIYTVASKGTCGIIEKSMV